MIIVVKNFTSKAMHSRLIATYLQNMNAMFHKVA